MGVKSFVKRVIKATVKQEQQIVSPRVTKVNVAQIQYGGILEGKRILITGGSRGLGFAIAKRALEEKALVAITGRTLVGLEEAKHKLGDSENLYIFPHDIMRIDTDDKLIADVVAAMGGIDCIINNAGVSVHDITYATCTEEMWDRQMNTNLKGAYFFTQAYMKYYNANHDVMKQGKIINMVSERGLYGDDVPYGLAKRALISYTEGMAKKLITKGIRVNAIAPGVTATDMTGYDPEGNLYRRYAQGKRVLLAEEIAEVAIFLLSDASNCISGQVIACNEANHLR